VDNDARLDYHGRCGSVYRRLLVVPLARSFAFPLLFIFAALFPLPFNFAVAVPVFFLVLSAVVLAAFAVAAFVLPGISKDYQR